MYILTSFVFIFAHSLFQIINAEVTSYGSFFYWTDGN